MATSKVKSNISNVNLNKIKKKLFLYFDKSHANQTNTILLKRYDFFYTLLTSMKI